MHRLSRTGRARAQRRADVRVGQQAIQFLIKEPIMRIPVQPAKPAKVTTRLLVESFRISPMGVPSTNDRFIVSFEDWQRQVPSQTYVQSKLRSRMAHHPNSGLQGGADREGGLGGP